MIVVCSKKTENPKNKSRLSKKIEISRAYTCTYSMYLETKAFCQKTILLSKLLSIARHRHSRKKSNLNKLDSKYNIIHISCFRVTFPSATIYC